MGFFMIISLKLSHSCVTLYLLENVGITKPMNYSNNSNKTNSDYSYELINYNLKVVYFYIFYLVYFF